MDNSFVQHQNDNVYSVEKVLKKRVRGGETQYLIKWRNYSNKYNTWEPEDNLLCPEVLRAFEEEWLKKQEANKKTEDNDCGPKILEPEKIIGVSRNGEYLMYLMKWKSLSEVDLVSSQQAKVKCPQLVIKFYEEHICWNAE